MARPQQPPLIEPADEWLAHGDLLSLHALNPRRYPHLLQSVGGQGMDILFAFPDERLAFGPGQGADFLAALAERVHVAGHATGTGQGLPFAGGWFLFLGYELAAAIEPRLELPEDPDRLPVAMMEHCPAAFVRDDSGRLWAVAPDRAHLEQMREDARAAPGPAEEPGPLALAGLEEEPPQRFLQGVERIRNYVREGDVFQVNLSRAWQGRLADEVDDVALFARLRATNPAPFAALATWDDRAIVSSSPERLVRIQGERVETRPIAGTRPRGQNDAEDTGLSAELMAHPKERAEHVMLIDLERNDLGRVCRAGTVQVDELMVIESYAHVHHIVSNVSGVLQPGRGAADVIRAVFPGGTITGCPKVRCMEIIAELEGTGRGAYTGSLGWLGYNGDMDLNILIRTLVRTGRDIRFRTGAGIVHDSVPDRELAETRHKAEGLLRMFAR
ncbi:MAG: aminodeoxychorismate synthase component I [Gammaproteobacteria bacterium]|nr:MAG: aminodeoxychorismate synthase component I [Gammaproteobacteria bacterium]